MAQKKLLTKAYPISEKDIAKWPELNKEYAKISINEMPKEAASTDKVRPFNWLEKLVLGNTDAVNYPWGTVALNKDAITKNKVDVGDVLVHELTHTKQRNEKGLLRYIYENLTGGNKKDEVEALGAEHTRPGKLLRKPAQPTGIFKNYKK